MARLPLELTRSSAPSLADLFNEAAALYQRGDFAGARRNLKLVLRKQPQQFDALHLMGLIEAQRGHHKDAEVLLRQAVRINPNSAEAHANRGNVQRELKRFDDAVASYDLALRLRANYPNALNSRAIALVALGRFDEALSSYDQALALDPNFATARYNRAIALVQLNRLEEAVAAFDEMLAREPAFVQAHVDRANALAALGRTGDALAAYDRALAFEPRFTPALYNRSLALLQAERFTEALESFDRTLAVEPGLAEAHDGRGNALLALDRFDEALAAFAAATQANPRFVGALNNRGYILMKRQRLKEALASFDAALTIDPRFVAALNNRGSVLLSLGRTDEALASFSAAADNSPDPVDALANRGNAAMAAKRFEAAVADFRRVAELDPDYAYALGNLFYCRMHCCDWQDYDETRAKLLAALGQSKRAVLPFASIACLESAEGQLSAAKTWAQDVLAAPAALSRKAPHDREKLRIAYVSWNFRVDPLSALMVELFEKHDRTRFETIAISYGPADGSPLRKRLEQAFDQFHDVVEKSDQEIAELMRDLDVDIAIDLTGFAENCRPGILALRPAPIQVNYLNYLGTMGVDHIDYVLADRRAMSAEIRSFFSEKVVYLPDTFIVADSTRRVSDKLATRGEMGLPESGIVFCCFNSVHKIAPPFFDIWMRLLRKIDGSVLWFAGGSPLAQRNLRAEAAARGVAAERIIFMPRVSDAETYLARYRLADLFLDTLPYNAITTAVDALWAGLPVLTCRGRTFAGRGATTMLYALGLPQLVAESPEAYEAAALRLATDPAALSDLKLSLTANRGTAALFKTDRFRESVERAYAMMWERHRRGEVPADFDVPPGDGPHP